MADDPYRTTAPFPPRGPRAPAGNAGELSQLAQYRIVKPLGRGGMGQVYEAEDLQLRRAVALKVMRPDLATEDSSRARFLQEARAAAALKHDHIVTIYQVGEDQGVPFLAMELLKGKSLDEWLRPDRRASMPETMLIGKQILKGLEAAHAAGLIHRDIKPANLWLEAPRGRVKILDFGLARVRAVEFTALTEDGAVLGTPAFMAPEQARGEAVDQRSDLFSFGCVLYRMVAGRLPFQGANYSAVLTALALETPTPVRQINPEVPPRLAELIERLLAKKADDRPASAKAALAEWHEIEKGVKPGPAPQIAEKPSDAETRTSSPRKFLSRRALLALAGLGTAAVAALVVIRSLDGAKPPPPDLGPLRLLELVDLQRDAIGGKWTATGGAVKGMTFSKNHASLILPWDPPAAYRLSMYVTRLHKGMGPAAIGLSSGPARYLVLLDFPVKEAFFTGILHTDPNTAEKQLRVGKTKVMRGSGERVRLTFTVEPGNVRVAVGDLVICNWAGGMNDLDRRILNVLERQDRTIDSPPAPLLIGSHGNSYYEFQDVLLEPLGPDRGQPYDPSE